MKDRLRFRVWNKRLEKMYNVRTVSRYQSCIMRIEVDDYENNNKLFIFDDYCGLIKDCVLMQCTGLKDKNGKLIYEGDIVHKKGSKNWKKEKLLSKVVWSKESAAFMISDENGLHQMPLNSNNIEVLGNIFENPELLKEEK